MLADLNILRRLQESLVSSKVYLKIRLEILAQGLSNSCVKLFLIHCTIYGIYVPSYKNQNFVVQRTEVKIPRWGLTVLFLFTYYHYKRHKNIHQNKKAVHFNHNDIVFRITQIHVIHVSNI